MKVKFIGNLADPSDNRGFIVWAGERFDLNIPRDLPEGKAFAKIATNNHFAVVEDHWDFDPNDGADKTDDQPAPDDKAKLIAFADQHGVKIDKRWSAAKITAAIEDAATAAESNKE